MMPRPQFILRALLVAMLVVPVAGYWLVRSRQVVSATHDYVRAEATYEMGTATFENVYDASRRLRDAELAMPLANRRIVMPVARRHGLCGHQAKGRLSLIFKQE